MTKLKLFGKDLFKKQVVKEATFYDFAQHGILKGTSNHMDYGDYIQMVEIEPGQLDTNKKKVSKEKLKELTPKEIHKLGTLTIPEMNINCDTKYIEEEVEVLKQKMELLLPNKPVTKRIRMPKHLGGRIADAWEIRSDSDLSGAYKYAFQEMQSMSLRLENRRQYKEFEEGFNIWPYTTNEAIAAVIKAHTHLEAENCAAMIPDLPKDAINQITAYNKLTEKLCGRRTNFYLIKEKAKKSDVERRRDPILLAQSPFGFFWQILGAWDEEVKFLEEL